MFLEVRYQRRLSDTVTGEELFLRIFHFFGKGIVSLLINYFSFCLIALKIISLRVHRGRKVFDLNS